MTLPPTSRARYPYPGNVRSITQEQVGQLLAELRTSAPRVVFLAAWTQYEVAGRVREVLHLRPSDLVPAGVRVARLKRSNPSLVAVSAALRAELDALARDVDARPAYAAACLFAGDATCRVPHRDGSSLACAGGHVGADTVFRHVQAAGRAIGLDPGLCKTHVLRHSAISHVAELTAGEPLNVTLSRLSEFSGHRNLQHLLHYLTNPREEAAWRERRSEAFGRVTGGGRDGSGR